MLAMDMPLLGYLILVETVWPSRPATPLLVNRGIFPESIVMSSFTSLSLLTNELNIMIVKEIIIIWTDQGSFLVVRNGPQKNKKEFRLKMFYFEFK